MGDNLSNHFNISYKPEGVFLTVVPSGAVDKALLLSHIIDTAAMKSIKNLDRKAVQLAVDRSNGQPVKIAEKQEEVKNTGIVVTVSQDKMSASITMMPSDSKIPSNEIVKILYSKGINYGLDFGVIDQIAQNPQYNVSVEVARGTKPEKGDDGRVELLFETNADRKPRILEDGTVDFHELNYAISVKKGQALANILQPKAGKDGRTVFGQIIPPLRGKPVAIPRGKNVDVVNNGMVVIASIDGSPSYIDNKIHVLTILDIPGNVDMGTGNIRFTGNVIVRGNVISDFVVEAGGNVEVYGVVEGATIKADGDIILRRGIQGNNKGVLVSGHDIVSKYIEHSNITAKNDIKCEAVMHSIVRCGNILELGGRKGLIVGGNIKVGKEIHAKVIGSPMCTMTDIEVGVDPTLRDRYKEVKEKLNTSETELSKANKSIELLKKMQAVNALTPDKRDMLNKLMQLSSYLTQQVSELQEQLNQMEEDLQATRKGRIKVQSIAYPGTKLTIGSASKFVKENTQYATFYLDGADIRAGAYDA